MVVTIVVLVILATISINAVLGENGLIARSQQAKDLHDQAQANEEASLSQVDELLANYMNGVTGGSGNGGNTPTDPTINWDLGKVDKVTSEDVVVVPVPKGYTASTIDGEKSVETGFVIKEGTDGSATEGINEFVWVPVPDITDLYDEANNAGQLWDFDGTTSTKLSYDELDIREPDVVTDASEGSDSTSGNRYDAVSANLQQAGLSSTATATDFKTQLQSEFNTMKNSVEKYGGFYIGRYETGNLSQSTAVVQKNNTDIADQTWYTMYKVSKTVAANSNVVSSMIWGCQWDATMRWMQTSSDEEVVNYVTDSTGKGQYCYDRDGNLMTDEEGSIPTGSNEAYSVNNIYDMAGNVWDWTLEATSTNHRMGRGGYYIYDDSSAPASSRLYDLPTVSSSVIGSRAVLYVAL